MNSANVLIYLYKNKNKPINQRVIAQDLEMSLGKTNELINKLVKNNYINKNYLLTSAGLEYLEKFKVDNAIILAAGLSSRFAPISFDKPKGLLRVRGEILIEKQIEQLHDAGINDITVVVGYKKEHFFYLADKYNVDIVVSKDYYQYNNSSSLLTVLDRLKNTYVCSSDNYIEDNIFNEYEPHAFYPVQKVNTNKDEDFYVQFNKSNQLITSITTSNGDYKLIGPVYFDKKLSKTIKEILPKEFETKEHIKHSVWESVLMDNLDSFNIQAKIDEKKIIKEFNTFEELRDFDPYYITNTNSQILNNISDVFNCKHEDIYNIIPIKSGLTNLSFSFEIENKKYIYRHPGVGTDSYINRQSEYQAQKLAKEIGLDDSFIAMDPTQGWKISKFINNARQLDYHNENEVKVALNKIKKLHDLKINVDFEFNIWKKTLDFINEIEENGRNNFPDFEELHNLMLEVKTLVDQDNLDKHLCHCDFYNPNILFNEHHMFLIDWEYSGKDDPGVDLGTFIACSDYTFEEAQKIIKEYLGKDHTLEKERHFIGYVALASYYWFVWAIFQDSNGANVGEYLYIWYRYAKQYGKKTLELYGVKYAIN